MIDIIAIKARMEAATAGRWEAVKQGDERGNPVPYYRGLVCILAAGKNGVSVVAESEWVPKEDWHPNADFIACAKEDVPALLAEIERLTKERDGALETVRCDDAHFARISETLGGTDEWPDRTSMLAYIFYLAQETETALTAARAENERLREGIYQALADMEDGNSVCGAAKAMLRYAYGDDSHLPEDDRLEYPLIAAINTLIACDEMHGKPSPLRAERDRLQKGQNNAG